MLKDNINKISLFESNDGWFKFDYNQASNLRNSIVSNLIQKKNIQHSVELEFLHQIFTKIYARI